MEYVSSAILGSCPMDVAAQRRGPKNPVHSGKRFFREPLRLQKGVRDRKANVPLVPLIQMRGMQ